MAGFEYREGSFKRRMLEKKKVSVKIPKISGLMLVL
jgi:hypothetical protein